MARHRSSRRSGWQFWRPFLLRFNEPQLCCTIMRADSQQSTTLLVENGCPGLSDHTYIFRMFVQFMMLIKPLFL